MTGGRSLRLHGHSPNNQTLRNKPLFNQCKTKSGQSKKQMMCVIAILGQSLQLFFNQILVVRVTLAHEPNFTVCIPVWHHHNKNGGKVYSLWTHTSVSKHHHSSAPLSWGPNDTGGPPTLPIFHALVLFLLLGWISPGCHVWTGSIVSSALG